MHIERKEIPDRAALILLGDEDFTDPDSIIRTVRMVLPYKYVTVFHLAHPTRPVRHALEFLRRCAQGGVTDPPRISWAEYAEAENMVLGAVKLGNRNCRVCCMAYWNGKDEDTATQLGVVATAGIETAIVPNERGLHGRG